MLRSFSPVGLCLAIALSALVALSPAQVAANLVQKRAQNACYYSCPDKANDLPLWNAGQDGSVYECLYGSLTLGSVSCYYDPSTGAALGSPVSNPKCPEKAVGPSCGSQYATLVSFLKSSD